MTSGDFVLPLVSEWPLGPPRYPAVPSGGCLLWR